MNLTQSQEDYLETIYLQCQKSDAKCAKVTDIANILDVKKASVTGALTSLHEKGLVNYAPYSPVTLTPAGESAAKKILLRHEVMQNFFKNILELPEEEAAQNACKMEHIMSEEMFKRIHAFSHFLEDYSSEHKDFKEKVSEYIKNF